MAKVFVLDKQVDYNDGRGYEGLTVGIYDTEEEVRKVCEEEIAYSLERFKAMRYYYTFTMYEWDTKTQETETLFSCNIDEWTK